MGVNCFAQEHNVDASATTSPTMTQPTVPQTKLPKVVISYNAKQNLILKPYLMRLDEVKRSLLSPSSFSLTDITLTL